MTTRRESTDFAALLQRFFVERLLHQRSASPRTVESYRDSFRLLLGLRSKRCISHQPRSRWRISTQRSLVVFSIILKQHVEIASGAETRDSLPSTPSTVMSVCSIRKHFDSPSRFWRSP